MLDTVLRRLAQRHLDHPGFVLFDAARDRGRAVLTASGRGLDLVSGERVLAAGTEGEGGTVLLVTDNRAIHLAADGTPSEVALDGLRGAASSPGVLRLATEAEEVTLVVDAAAEWSRFFSAVACLHPAARQAPAAPLPWPTERDAAATAVAKEGLWGEDAYAVRSLDVLQRRLEQGQVSVGEAVDLTRRIVLAHRSWIAGPAMLGGRWLSGLGAGDFSEALGQIFGPGTDRPTDRPGVGCLDFHVVGDRRDPSHVRRRKRSGTVQRSAVVRPGDQPIRRLRFLFSDAPSACGYRVSAPVRALHEADPTRLRALQDALMAIERRALLLRAIYGPERSLGALLTLPSSEVEQALGAEDPSLAERRRTA